MHIQISVCKKLNDLLKIVYYGAKKFRYESQHENKTCVQSINERIDEHYQYSTLMSLLCVVLRLQFHERLMYMFFLFVHELSVKMFILFM